MADQTGILELLIKLGVVGSDDVKAAKGLLDDYSASSAALDKEMGVHRVTQEEMSKALGKTAEGAKLGSYELRHLAMVMGQGIPGGGEFLRALFNPEMAGLFMLIGGIEYLHDTIKKMNEEQKQSEKIQEDFVSSEPSKVIEKQTDAWREAEVSEAEYHHNLLKNSQDVLARLQESAQSVLKAKMEAQGKSDDVRKGSAEKEIDDMEKRGVVNHEAAVKMKEEIDEAYSMRKIQRMMIEDSIEQNMLKNRIGEQEYKAKHSVEVENQAAGAYKDAVGKKAENDEKIAQAQERIAKAKSVIKELESTGVTADNIQKLNESFEEVSGQSSVTTPLSEQFTYLSRHMGGIVPRQLFGTQGDVNLGAYQGAQAEITGEGKLLKGYKGQQTDLDITVGNAKSDLDDARREVQESRKNVQELQDKLTDMQHASAIHAGSALDEFGAGKANSSLIADRNTADTLSRGGNVTPEEQQKLISDASAIAGHVVDLKTAIQIVENGANNIGIFMAQINRLASIFGKLNPNQMAELQHSVDVLQQQIQNKADKH